MSDLNRNLAPEFNPIKQVTLLPYEKIVLNNATPHYILKQTGSGVCKIEWIFDAGFVYQSKPLLAYFTNQMLENGTKTKSNSEFNAALDALGSYLELHCDQDTAMVTLYSLTKFTKESILLIYEMLSNPAFSEDEFERYKQQQIQEYLIQSQKVSFQARRLFSNKYFGASHPYAVSSEISDFKAINVLDIKDFFKQRYTHALKMVFSSGDLPESIHEFVQSFTFPSANALINNIPAPNSAPGQHWHLMPDKIQCALRVGMPWVNRSHPDYFHLQFLNMLFGGYFGSRLMSNIREDKGYTYGIGSSVQHYKHHSFLIISTEIDASYSNNTIKEIKHEIQLLQNERCKLQEIETVRNFLLGNLLRQMDGIFNQSDVYKTLLLSELSNNYYQSFANHLYQINPERIQQLAQKYFSFENLVVCGAGKV